MAGGHPLLRLALLAAAWLCLGAIQGPAWAAGDDYVRIEDYLERHPGQQVLVADFARRVSSPARPITGAST